MSASEAVKASFPPPPPPGTPPKALNLEALHASNAKNTDVDEAVREQSESPGSVMADNMRLSVINSMDGENAYEHAVEIELKPSPASSDGCDVPEENWVRDLLLLTHDALRCDMSSMQRALEPKYLGDVPPSWRIRTWFIFFQSWAAIISQMHVVEVEVLYDYLAAPTGKMPSEMRTEVLAYQRSVQLELLSIARLERRILNELATTDWGTAEPWSECAELLRVRVRNLCVDLETHLDKQMADFPKILTEHWGQMSPPGLHRRMMDAAKGAQSAADKGSDSPKLMLWVLHYLTQRDAAQANHLISRLKLPFFKRQRLKGRVKTHYDSVLDHLRCIILDREPRLPRLSPADLTNTGVEEESTIGPTNSTASEDSAVERRRRAGTVNAVLAAANAQRRDLNIQGQTINTQLAEQHDPVHTFKADGNWMNRVGKVPSGIFKKIGMEKKPDTPRRV